MRKRLISAACWLAGILLVLGLYFVAAVTHAWWIILLAIVSATLDARHVRIWRYRSDIARSPGTLLILMLLLGWLVLPWYLGLRLKIFVGAADLKPEYRWVESHPLSSGIPPSPPGLLQPWKRR
jgi:hypothetical protein